MAPKDNSDWALDEWILSLEIFLNNGHLTHSEQMSYLKKHVEMRQQLGKLLGHKMSSTYRNADGLWLNQQQLFNLQPGGKKGRISKGAKRVWKIFRNHPDSLRKACDLIYANLYPFINASHRRNGVLAPDLSFDNLHAEGFYLTYQHVARDKPMTIAAVSSALAAQRKQDALLCQGCGQEQADRKNTLLHCHYIGNQLEMLEHSKFKHTQYRLYCEQCHDKEHAKRPWINLQEQHLAL